MDFSDVDLGKELSDSVFEVHEEVFDEDSLFKIHLKCDDILKMNDKARLDGVFKIKLADGLRDTGSTLTDFWSKMGNIPYKFLHSLFLKGDKSTFVLENKSRKVSSSTAFSQAAKRPETFDISSGNCCMKAVETGGWKGAVIHFYEALESKAAVSKLTDVAQSCTSPRLKNSSKRNYQERQAYLTHEDMNLRCEFIEASMKSAKYAVNNAHPSDESVEKSCACPRCQQSFLSESVKLEPINVKDDGDGDNCSLYFNGIEQSLEQFLYITPNFAMSHVCHLNMLTDLDSYYAGISFPYVYLGGLHSFFPLHVEDLSLYSINYNHLGFPKLIIVVAPSEISKLLLLLSYYGVTSIHRNCINKLSHKALVVFPQWLLKHQIKFKVILQFPGEFVVFAPNAAHTGGNMGPNLCEACNFGTPDWLPYGSVAAQNSCDCMYNPVHMDVTQLIKDHRKDLLNYHLRNSMWCDFKEKHFQLSIIVPQESAAHLGPNVLVANQFALPVHASTSIEAKKSNKKASTLPLACPVDGCFKKYKVPNKELLKKHIIKLHPKAAAAGDIWQIVNALFYRKKNEDSS